MLCNINQKHSNLINLTIFNVVLFANIMHDILIFLDSLKRQWLKAT